MTSQNGAASTTVPLQPAQAWLMELPVAAPPHRLERQRMTHASLNGSLVRSRTTLAIRSQLQAQFYQQHIPPAAIQLASLSLAPRCSTPCAPCCQAARLTQHAAAQRPVRSCSAWFRGLQARLSSSNIGSGSNNLPSFQMVERGRHRWRCSTLIPCPALLRTESQSGCRPHSSEHCLVSRLCLLTHFHGRCRRMTHQILMRVSHTGYRQASVPSLRTSSRSALGSVKRSAYCDSRQPSRAGSLADASVATAPTPTQRAGTSTRR